MDERDIRLHLFNYPASLAGTKDQSFMNTIVISSAELTLMCEKLARVLNSKNSLPALDSFLFRVDGGTLYISASDSENFATGTLVPSEVSGDMTFGLDARTLVAALKQLPEQPLTLTLGDGSCTVSYTNGHFSLPLSDVDGYPVFPQMKEPSSVTVTSDVFSRILSRVPAFAANDELRPIMCGICFSYDDGRLESVASDGHSLIRLTDACTPGVKGLFVMSVKTARLAESFLGRDTQDVTVCHDATHSYVRFPSFELTSRLVDGRYPNYNAVIPTTYTDFIEVDRKELLSVVRRAAVFASSASQLLKLKACGMQLDVTGQDVDYSTLSEATMMVSKSGADLTIGLKSTIMATILSTLTAERVLMQYADASRAVIFRPAEESDGHAVLMLQMPMMLND